MFFSCPLFIYLFIAASVFHTIGLTAGLMLYRPKYQIGAERTSEMIKGCFLGVVVVVFMHLCQIDSFRFIYLALSLTVA